MSNTQFIISTDNNSILTHLTVYLGIPTPLYLTKLNSSCDADEDHAPAKGSYIILVTLLT